MPAMLEFFGQVDWADTVVNAVLSALFALGIVALVEPRISERLDRASARRTLLFELRSDLERVLENAVLLNIGGDERDMVRAMASVAWNADGARRIALKLGLDEVAEKLDEVRERARVADREMHDLLTRPRGVSKRRQPEMMKRLRPQELGLIAAEALEGVYDAVGESVAPRRRWRWPWKR